MHSLRHYFFLSLILHATVIGILLFLNWQPSPLPVRKTINAPIIQAVAVPAEKIQQELERLNELEKEKERKDQKRLSMLEEEKKRQEQVRLRTLEEEKKRQEQVRLRALEEEKKRQEQVRLRALEEEKKRQEQVRLRALEEEKKRQEQVRQRTLEEEKKRQEQVRQRTLEEEKKRQEQVRQRTLEEEKKQRNYEESRRKALEEEKKRRAEEKEQMAAQRERDTAVIDHYRGLIHKRIVNKFNIQGLPPGLLCRITLRIAPGGNIISVRMVESSGNEIFDQRAIDATYKSGPYPVPQDQRLFEEVRTIHLTFAPDFSEEAN